MNHVMATGLALLAAVLLSPAASAATVYQPAAVGVNGDVRIGDATLSRGKITDDSFTPSYVAATPGVSPTNELDWLRTVTGKAGLTFIDRVDVSGEGCKTGCSFGLPSGPAKFGYFIVKASNDLVAFKNGGDLALAQYSGLANGTSHVSFVTPIPAALPLMLAGIGGLAAYRRLARKG